MTANKKGMGDLPPVKFSFKHELKVREAFLKMGHTADDKGDLVALKSRADRHGMISLKDHKIAERYAKFYA